MIDLIHIEFKQIMVCHVRVREGWGSERQAACRSTLASLWRWNAKFIVYVRHFLTEQPHGNDITLSTNRIQYSKSFGAFKVMIQAGTMRTVLLDKVSQIKSLKSKTLQKKGFFLSVSFALSLTVCLCLSSLVNVTALISNQLTTLGLWFDCHLSKNKSQNQIKGWSVLHKKILQMLLN